MIKLNPNDKLWIDSFYERVEQKLERSAKNLKDIIPHMTENGGYYDQAERDVTWWTNGFFGGMMWLLYEHTKKDIYKIAAKRQVEILDAALTRYDGLHHDVGFMFELTAKADYLLTGEPKSRVRAIYAANTLMSRTNIRGQYIKAWDHADYTIIDSLLNIPILYWASREFKDDRYKYVGIMQAESLMKHHVRDDGSVVHIAVHNTQKDEVIETLAGQGYKVGSAWSRGQAWAVYGFILSNIHTKEQRFLDTAIKVADYFIKETEKYNYKVRTDFCQPDDVDYIDNSAAVCAICGIIEIYKATGEEKYLDAAISILRALEADCDFSEENDSILQKGMIAYSLGEQVDMIYNDFFLCEALLKLRDSQFLIW